MMAYGNMSAAEKHINKQDLISYKNYDNTNHAMIPGLKETSELPKRMGSPPKNRSQSLGLADNSPRKATIDVKVQQNTDKMMQYGAVHLGKNVATLEPKLYLG